MVNIPGAFTSEQYVSHVEYRMKLADFLRFRAVKLRGIVDLEVISTHDKLPPELLFMTLDTHRGVRTPDIVRAGGRSERRWPARLLESLAARPTGSGENRCKVIM